jgi:hypothetical protein
MFARQSLTLSRPQRLWWSAAALALTLMVPITTAATASPARPIDNLRRDLGALQAQIEQIVPGLREDDPHAVGFNADLGDGSPAFRRLSLVTMVHAAARNLDELIAAYRAAGDQRRAGDAQTLRVSMYELSERIERLAAPAGPKTITVLGDQSRTQLAELAQDLDLLAAEPAAEPPAAAAPPH